MMTPTVCPRCHQPTTEADLHDAGEEWVCAGCCPDCTDVALFLSGPMRGLKHFGFPSFHAAREDLRRSGFTVWCPAESDVLGGFDPIALDLHGNHSELVAHAFATNEALLWCCERICLHVEGVALLPGWETSAGARAEWHLAQALGLPCSPVDEWLELARTMEVGE